MDEEHYLALGFELTMDCRHAGEPSPNKKWFYNGREEGWLQQRSLFADTELVEKLFKLSFFDTADKLERFNHRDKTRVLSKMFPHLKLLCLLFMGPTLGFDTKQKTVS
jgi:hypothetical protein